MDGIFKFIMKIISITLIIIAFLILLSSLYKIGTFEDIKNTTVAFTTGDGGTLLLFLF